MGIKITPNINYIVPSYFDPLLKRVLESLNKWGSMPISLIGHISIVKMSYIFFNLSYVYGTSNTCAFFLLLESLY